MTRTGLGASVAVLVLASTLSATAATQGQATQSQATQSQATQSQATQSPAAARAATTTTSTVVTLPTGDRVALSGTSGQPTQVRIDPRSATAAGAATVLAAGGHTYVVPAAAAGLVGRGLDLSMFDVTALAAATASAQRPLQLAATFGATYRSLPPGLTRTSPTTVSVTDPAAFGAALTRSWLAEKRTGSAPTLLDGLTLARPGAATSNGRLTKPPHGSLYTVKVTGIDRNGAKANGDLGVLANTDNTARYIAGQSFYHGTFSFSVPRGHYFLESYISDVNPHGVVEYTLATIPQLLVDHDVTVTLDARKGTSFTVATPRPSLAVHAELNIQEIPTAGLPFTASLTTFGGTSLFATPTKRVTVGKVAFYPAMRLGDASGSLDRYLYDLAFSSQGKVPETLDYTVTADQLATVKAQYASVVPDQIESESRIGGLPWQTNLVGSINNLTAPLSRIEYVTAQPRLAWHQEVDLDPNGGNGRTLAETAVYRPGQHLTTLWNNQPMGSGVEQERRAGQPCPICRSGDTLSVAVFPHVDADNNFMLEDAVTTDALTLYQDGTQVGQSPGGFASFPLSPDPASYRLVYDVDSPAPWFPTSSHVTTSWTFDSQEREPSQLPPGWTCGGKFARDDGCSFEQVLLPHYVTSAGLDGVIAAGTTAHVTVDVTPQRGLDPDPLTSLAAKVSYDGGKHWKTVQSKRKSDSSYQLSYDQPALGRTDGYASLRITAAGASGAGVDQTIIHAYPLAPAEAAPPAPSTGQPACTAAAPAPKTRCQIVVNTSSVGSADPVGYGPADIRAAYHLPAHASSDATVAVVTPYDDPNAAADLAVYRAQFGLAACTTLSGCLSIVNQRGDASPLPPAAPDWALQTSQALDAISATCPSCKILVVEADSTSLDDLAVAALTADRLGADVISNGAGTVGEFSGEQRYEKTYRRLDVPFVAGSGDYGYGNGVPLVGSISYPSASRFAIAVGGTTLTRSAKARGFTETAWSNTTSGCSAYIAKPAWQHDALCGKRTTADVAAVADPATALAVYDTYQLSGWVEVGGTSLATAIVAGVFGLADDGGAAAGLYADGASLFDVTTGANGACHRTYLCTAKPGYDGPSGVGTPNGVSAF